jgi:hypothetical protein
MAKTPRDAELRRLIAAEAARVMTEQALDARAAVRKAAERLGARDQRSWPNLAEVDAALAEYQRIFRADEQPARLRALREAAVEAMQFFERFEPRLVGAVLEGIADAHSGVALHLFADNPDSVGFFLDERGVPYEHDERKLAYERGEPQAFPVYRFTAGDTAVDLTVFPLDGLRQAPLGRDGEKPMRRAGLAAVRELLDQER